MRTKDEELRYDNTDRLISAAYNGLLWEVNNLIPLSDVDGFESKALRVAIERGHQNCVEALLPVTSPTWVRLQGMRTVASFDRSSMVELLLPYTQPIQIRAAVNIGLWNNAQQTVLALLPHTTPQMMDDIRSNCLRRNDGDIVLELLERLQSQLQRETIVQNLDDAQLNPTKRKM